MNVSETVNQVKREKSHVVACYISSVFLLPLVFFLEALGKGGKKGAKKRVEPESENSKHQSPGAYLDKIWDAHRYDAISSDAWLQCLIVGTWPRGGPDMSNW